MSGTSAWLADNVASLLPSLLPKTTAAACVGSSTWVSNRTTCGPGGNGCCDSSRTCRYSCYGRPICTGWHKYFCW
jgi:hypothetical protein